MRKDPFVFAQLVQFMNRSKFNRMVAKYDGDKYVKSFSCWNESVTYDDVRATNQPRTALSFNFDATMLHC